MVSTYINTYDMVYRTFPSYEGYSEPVFNHINAKFNPLVNNVARKTLEKRYAGNTRKIQLNSKVQELKQIRDMRIKKEREFERLYSPCVDYRDYVICINADITASKMFACRSV